MQEILGIDVGGTNTKGAIVNIETGTIVSEKIKIPTPAGAKPNDVLGVMQEIKRQLNWQEDFIGVGFPAIIQNGICKSASNISDDWIGINVDEFFSDGLSADVVSINDADAAGKAEMNFGKAKGVAGTVLLLTIGTGIGSALFRDGILVPNTELGRMYYKGHILEQYASNRTRKVNNMELLDWAKHLDEVLLHIDFIFSPDLIILGGGISKSLEKYQHILTVDAPIVSALQLNNAGIIGAAVLRSESAMVSSV